MSQPSPTRRERYLLLIVILLYLVLGTLYALFTPDWQAPDEPAHYNYVRYLAEQHSFPILKPGDYPAAYLEEIKTAHFPSEMSIEPIRYEFHQPPLYYLLAAPFYQVAGGQLLALRLLSVAMGVLLLVVIYWTVEALVPERSILALGATAFVAFLPMHLATTAAVNNDILAEILLTTVLLLCIGYLRRTGRPGVPGEETRLLVLLGITTGLGLVTKSTVYIALPLALSAIAARHLWLEKDPSLSPGLKAMGLYLLPALALALPWWLRNIVLYGGFDFLGLGRHDQVVAGQLRTAEFVAEHGLGQLLQDLATTTFRSFWGQFGWMGVLLDQRIYQALAILSGLALVGLVLWAIRAGRRWQEYPEWQRAGGGLLLLLGLLTLATYLWYNLGFLQHQGRYLFRALVPVSLAVALGWREALRRRYALPLAAAFLVSGLVLRLVGLLPNWPLVMLVVLVAALGVRHFLPHRLDPLVQAAPYLLLIPLDLACLFLFIVPQLGS
jgi:4-amino-4-deoxy-L-arabinose transferase-like glycosyltransferase